MINGPENVGPCSDIALSCFYKFVSIYMGKKFICKTV